MAENTTYTHTKYADADGFASGQVVFDATAITAADFVEIDLGFKPRKVFWNNVTAGITGLHYQGMADNSCQKSVAAGDKTLEVTGVNGGITLTDRGFKVLQNATLALITASKTCFYEAQR
jgi:hypothetical protein